MESVVPQIVRESATSKAQGKKWLFQNMNAQNAFVTNGRLHDKEVPTVVLQDCMVVVKGVRRHNPARNVLAHDPALPLALPLATAYEALLHPLLSSYRHYSQRARHDKFDMALCFDYYGVENAAKAVCHEQREELSESEDDKAPPLLVPGDYIKDWANPLPENWDEVLSSRKVGMPIILRNITKEIARQQQIAPSHKLIICGHSLDLHGLQQLADERSGDRDWEVPVLSEAELRTLPLVLETKRAYFDPRLRVEQIEGDLQIFSLLRALATRKQDIVHVVSKDTDVMYYALWYAASAEMTHVGQLLWKHQWSRDGDSWVDIYRLCETIESNPRLGAGKFQQAVKNLVVCLMATGTDYTSGYQGIGHVKWMKPMLTMSLAPLFGAKVAKSGEKRNPEEEEDRAPNLNQAAYYALTEAALGRKKMAGNRDVILAMGQHLDYVVQRLLRSVGHPSQPAEVRMEDFMFHPESKRRLYTPTPSSSSSSSKGDLGVL